MNIVICEDHRSIQDLVEMVLEENGHVVYKCDDSDSLIEIVQVQTVDLLIIDYWLGKVTAEESIKKIEEDYPEIPIILISAVSNLAEISDRLGIKYTLHKPFDIEELKLKVNTIVYDS